MSLKMAALASLMIVLCFALGAILFWPRNEVPAVSGPSVTSAPVVATATATHITVDLTAATVLAKQDDGLVVEVSTEALKSGELKMSDVNTPSLLHLLDDLNERLSNDKAQHGGNPGPDGAYLSEWSGKVALELQGRGMKVAGRAPTRSQLP